MPSAKKVHWAQLRVGFMAIVAMVILAVLVFLLTGQKKLFARNADLYTYLSDSAALTNNSPVRLNGILIGKVEKVELSGSNDPKRIIRVKMTVESDKLAMIPVDSVAGIDSENVLGAKYINIRRGTSRQTVKPGGEIQAEDTQEFQDLVKRAFPLLESLQSIVGRVDKIVGQVELGKGSVGKLLASDELYDRLNATVGEFQKISESIGSGRGTVGKLLYDEGLYNDARSSIQRLESLLTEIQQGQGTAGKLIKDPALYDDLRSTAAEAKKMMADINAGKGTAGKLLKDEELYRQMQGLITKLDNTIDRMNSGQGTLGQLLVNPQLYDSLNGMSGELNGLIKDIRANPKKFLRIKLGLF